jgi:hypothetical protein
MHFNLFALNKELFTKPPPEDKEMLNMLCSKVHFKNHMQSSGEGSPLQSILGSCTSVGVEYFYDLSCQSQSQYT